ncbi:MAG: hypothetical protein PGN24_00815 [Microbacterium arborescens]
MTDLVRDDLGDEPCGGDREDADREGEDRLRRGDVLGGQETGEDGQTGHRRVDALLQRADALVQFRALRPFVAHGHLLRQATSEMMGA